jgi:hypothetical protein
VEEEVRPRLPEKVAAALGEGATGEGVGAGGRATIAGRRELLDWRRFRVLFCSVYLEIKMCILFGFTIYLQDKEL